MDKGESVGGFMIDLGVKETRSGEGGTLVDGEIEKCDRGGRDCIQQ